MDFMASKDYVQDEHMVMPCALFFGHVPQSALIPGASKHVVNEEDMNSWSSADQLFMSAIFKIGACLFQFQLWLTGCNSYHLF